MKKIALITGIGGQDAAYLANFLLTKNYKVIGSYRSKKKSTLNLKKLNIKNRIIYEKLDILEKKKIIKLIKKYKINEIYNLASQSYVNKSFNKPIETMKVNILGVLNLLESIKEFDPKIKFYQASSSEMFGNSKEKSQSELSNFYPESPYAISKLSGHYITRYYRNTHKLFAVSGILFNHESPLRDDNYVIKKIVNGLIEIKKKKKKYIELGNIYSKRDWGYAKEYVQQMWKMLQLKKPKDFVIATGKTYSIKQLINYTTQQLSMSVRWNGIGINEKLINLENNKIIIRINKELYRPSDIKYTRGNIQKAKKYLKWKPKTNLRELVKILIEN